MNRRCQLRPGHLCPTPPHHPQSSHPCPPLRRSRLSHPCPASPVFHLTPCPPLRDPASPPVPLSGKRRGGTCGQVLPPAVYLCAMPEREAPGTVRLDKWLWAARFYKTRALAVEAIDGGKVDVNGQGAKRAKAVRVGDRIQFRQPPYAWDVAVKGLSERRGPASVAVTLYEETTDSRRRGRRWRSGSRACRRRCSWRRGSRTRSSGGKSSGTSVGNRGGGGGGELAAAGRAAPGVWRRRPATGAGAGPLLRRPRGLLPFPAAQRAACGGRLPPARLRLRGQGPISGPLPERRAGRRGARAPPHPRLAHRPDADPADHRRRAARQRAADAGLRHRRHPQRAGLRRAGPPLRALRPRGSHPVGEHDASAPAPAPPTPRSSAARSAGSARSTSPGGTPTSSAPRAP